MQIADWINIFVASGTILSSVVALYLANRKPRIKYEIAKSDLKLVNNGTNICLNYSIKIINYSNFDLSFCFKGESLPSNFNGIIEIGKFRSSSFEKNIYKEDLLTDFFKTRKCILKINEKNFKYKIKFTKKEKDRIIKEYHELQEKIKKIKQL